MRFFHPNWRSAKRGSLTIFLLLAGGVSLVACGGEPAPPTITPLPTQDLSSLVNSTPVNPIQSKASNAVQVQLEEWAIIPGGLGVPSGATSFTVLNKGKFAHNLVIKNGNTEVGRTPNFTSAESPKIIEVNLQPGAYTWLCDIPGHAEQGMKGTLTVGP